MLNTLPVPARTRSSFEHGIRHPECFLWDAWSCFVDGAIYLYTLALSRQNADGEPMLPSCRATSQFHIRQFVSFDDGISFRDVGVFQRAGSMHDGHDARNIWSGSVLSRDRGKNLWAAYTSIHQIDSAHPFVQCLCVGRALAGGAFEAGSGRTLLCPIADRERVDAAGYFFSRDAGLGDAQGEAGGPIMAWRDPFLFRSACDQLYMAWAAKRANGEPAMGLATLSEQSGELFVEHLFAPAPLPDADQFSQFEIPKIYFDAAHSRYILIAATTDRQSETQDGGSITADIRVYYSASIDGPWLPGGTGSSVLLGADHCFGMTILYTDADQLRLIGVAPLTDQAPAEEVLTVSPRFSIDLTAIGRARQLTIDWIL